MDSRVLKEMTNILDTPLTILYNKSITAGILPADWKCANVTSVFKKVSKLDDGKYRPVTPVSLTSVPCKVLESVIPDSLIKYFDKMNLYLHLNTALLVSL